MMWTSRSIAGRLIPGLVLAASLAAAPAAAQNTATISGTIIDNTGQVVPGATVTLTNEATSDARTTVSGGHGEFAFRAVAPGSYTVRVELTGFRTHQQKGNVLNASGTLDLGNVKLDLGTITEVVSVVSEGSVIETKNSDYSGLLTADFEDPEPRPRRGELAAPAAGRALRSGYRGHGRQLRLADSQHRWHAEALEPGHRRRPERQRALGHEPDESTAPTFQATARSTADGTIPQRARASTGAACRLQLGHDGSRQDGARPSASRTRRGRRA